MTYGAELQLTSQSEEDNLVDDSQAERDEVDFIQEQRNSSKGTNSFKKSSNSKGSAESKNDQNDQLEQIIENNLEDVMTTPFVPTMSPFSMLYHSNDDGRREQMEERLIAEYELEKAKKAEI